MIEPELSVISVLPDDTPTRAWPLAIGSLHSYNESHYPDALIFGHLALDRYPFEISSTNDWMEQSAFVYAERVLPSFRRQYSSWFSFQSIQSTDFTYPSGSDDYSKQQIFMAQILLSMLTVSGANNYANRWVGWGIVLWVSAFVLHIERFVLPLSNDIGFCQLTCLNSKGYEFNSEADTPSFINVPVYQNGTCENDFQKSRSNGVEKRAVGFLASFGAVQETLKNPAQPYRGCMAWRDMLTIPTQNLSVRAYDSSMVGSGRISNSDFTEKYTCVNETVVENAVPIGAECGVLSAAPLKEQFQSCMLAGDSPDSDQLSPDQVEKLVGKCLDVNVFAADLIQARGRPDVLEGSLEECSKDLTYCLVFNTPQQCAQQCAVSTVGNQVDQATPLDLGNFTLCAQDHLSGPLLAELNSRADFCANKHLANNNELAIAFKSTFVCTSQAVSELAREKCGVTSISSFVRDGYLAILGEISATALGTSMEAEIEAIVSLGKINSTDSGGIPFKEVSFAEAVNNSYRRCHSRLKGSGPDFSNQVLWPVLQIYASFFLAWFVLLLLIFILVDAVYVTIFFRSRMSLRDRICQKLRFFHRKNACSRINPNMILKKAKVCVSYVCFCLDATPEESDSDDENDNEPESSSPRNRQHVRRWCRAMPNMLVVAVLFNSLVIFFLSVKLFQACAFYQRWGLVLGNAVVEIPKNVEVVKLGIQGGNISRSEAVVMWQGDAIPEGSPPLINYFMSALIKLVVHEGDIGDIHASIRDDPTWEIVFSVIYWFIVLLIVASYIGLCFSIISFILQTRGVWKQMSGISKSQKELLRKSFHPKTGWDTNSEELMTYFKHAGTKGVINQKLRYAYIAYSAPFTALYFWMSVTAFFCQFVVVIACIAIPALLLAGVVLYFIYNALAAGKTPLDGLKYCLMVITNIAYSQGLVLFVTTLIKYASRRFFYSRTGGIRHPTYETFYYFSVSITYLLLGVYHAYMRTIYTLLAFAFRIGSMDHDLVGFGLDYSFMSYLGLVDSMRLKNEFEFMCTSAMNDRENHYVKSPLADAIIGSAEAVAISHNKQRKVPDAISKEVEMTDPA